ncbi:MAG: hypothetical protein ACLQGT_15890 [Terracidiphilus sp.]
MTIPFEEIAAKWLANPGFKREYDALAPEFEAYAESLADPVRFPSGLAKEDSTQEP